MNGIDMLLSVAELTARHGDPTTAAWLQTGLDRYLSSQDRPTLDAALGLGSTGPGKPAAATKHRKAIRNHYLKKAYYLIEPTKTPTARCETLAREIRRFESIIWPRLIGEVEPPAGCSELRKMLFHSKKTGEVLPQNFRTVWRAVFDF